MENEIRIHPIGERTTDYEFAEMISRVYPLSFRKAQDVLVATRKYVYKKGLFSTESSRIKNLQTECYELMQTLKKDFEEESAGFRDEEWRNKRTFLQFPFILFRCVSQLARGIFSLESSYPTVF